MFVIFSIPTFDCVQQKQKRVAFFASQYSALRKEFYMLTVHLNLKAAAISIGIDVEVCSVIYSSLDQSHSLCTHWYSRTRLLILCTQYCHICKQEAKLSLG